MSSVKCPVCMREMGPNHQPVQACKCGYEIRTWCWAQITQATEGICTACRVSIKQRDVASSSHHQLQPLQQQQPQQQTPSHLRLRSIPRNVQTAKGPRARCVTLGANTTHQLYNIKHRLGYDIPSLAVDWLIMNAEAAIDRLPDLPAD